jgi:HK97 family phage major capsid protein
MMAGLGFAWRSFGPPFFLSAGDASMIEVKADEMGAGYDALLQDERLAAVEADIGALKGQVADAFLASRRPVLDGVKGVDGARDAARVAFVDRYLRRGLEAGVELKSFAGATDAAGGYAVPREIDAAIDATLKSISPIRSIANVVKTGSAGYRKLVTSGGTASGWAAETGARAETATPTFNEIAPPRGELFANPAASQAMLDDAQFDVEAWLPDVAADSLSIAFGNFTLGYVIAERNETSILRDPFSNKPFVHFYAVKRIGGAVANSEAIKLMKFAAS